MSTKTHGIEAGPLLKWTLNSLKKRKTAVGILQLLICTFFAILTSILIIWFWQTLKNQLKFELPSTTFTEAIDWFGWTTLLIAAIIWMLIFRYWWKTVEVTTGQSLLFFNQRIIIGHSDVLNDDGSRATTPLALYYFLEEGEYAIPFFGIIWSLGETVSMKAETERKITVVGLTKKTGNEGSIRWKIWGRFISRTEDAGRRASIDPGDADKAITSAAGSAILSFIMARTTDEMKGTNENLTTSAVMENSKLHKRCVFYGESAFDFIVEGSQPESEEIIKADESIEYQRRQSKMQEDQLKAVQERAVIMAGGEDAWAGLDVEKRQKFIELSMLQDPEIAANMFYFGGGDAGSYTKGKAFESKRGKGTGKKRKGDFDEE